EKLRRFFGTSELLFGKGYNRIVFQPQALRESIISADPELYQALKGHFPAAPGSQQTVAEQVRGVLKKRLPNGAPLMDEVARELQVSPRTLQRRLSKHEVRYEQILEQLRMELAREYLQQPSLPNEEVAFLLGYSDGTAFSRAFRRWEGKSPNRYRGQFN